MRRIFSSLSGWFALGALLVGASCGEPTSAPSADLASHRAQWVARRPGAYQYEYGTTGFFNAYGGRRFRLVVRDGAVQSATDVATGQPVADSATRWPTVDQLFDQAVQAAAAGTLRGARYDPTYSYPTELDLAGPPDASGSLLASALAPLP